MVEPTPIHGQLLLLVLRSRKVMKQTTEVSGNQTPEACFLLSSVSTRQAGGAGRGGVGRGGAGPLKLGTLD
jgi:hypothetical protein